MARFAHINPSGVSDLGTEPIHENNMPNLLLQGLRQLKKQMVFPHVPRFLDLCHRFNADVTSIAH